MSLAQACAAFQIILDGREIVETHRKQVARGQIEAFHYRGYSSGAHRVDVKSTLFGPVRFIEIKQTFTA